MPYLENTPTISWQRKHLVSQELIMYVNKRGVMQNLAVFLISENFKLKIFRPSNQGLLKQWNMKKIHKHSNVLNIIIKLKYIIYNLSNKYLWNKCN